MAIKTNAIKDYNAAVVKQSGRVGTVRYYTKSGLTYVRAASNSNVTNNRTNAQMTQRLCFSSLAALFSTFAPHLRGAFQNKAKNMSFSGTVSTLSTVILQRVLSSCLVSSSS